MRLVAAANVEVSAILLLEDRGYVLTVKRSQNVETWAAARGEVERVGDGPLQLLGLASLAEARGSSWRASDEQIQDALARFQLG